MDHSNGGEEVSIPTPFPPSAPVTVAPAPAAPIAPTPAPAAATPAPASAAVASATAEASKKNRIQVSNTKKPLFFYVNLAKRFMQQYEEVELSALGMAIATVVTVVEILKNNGLAIEKKISTSTVDIVEEVRNRPVQKAKMEIVLQKSEKFDELMAAAAEENGTAEEHYE